MIGGCCCFFLPAACLRAVCAFCLCRRWQYGGGGIPVDAFFGTLRDTLSGKDKLYTGAASGAEADALLAEAGPTETAFSMARKRNTKRSSELTDRSPSPSPRKTKTAPNAGYVVPSLSSLNPLPKFQVHARCTHKIILVNY